MKKFYSFFAALSIGLLAVSPPEFWHFNSKYAILLGGDDPNVKRDYFMPVIVNSFYWLYAVIAFGLIAFFLTTVKSLDKNLRIFLIYTFIAGCFFSQVPYMSFTSFILLVLAFMFFLVLKNCDIEIVLNMITAVFWLQLTLATLSYLGMDTLTNLGEKNDTPVFFGTIFQHMRFGSLLCVLSAFMIIRSKWYYIPVIFAAVMSRSSGMAMAIVAAGVVKVILSHRKFDRRPILYVLGILALATAWALTLGSESFIPAFRDGRIPVWGVIIRTWIFDTRGALSSVGAQVGPFDIKTFLIGHGLDSFYPLFPMYKHDNNPFPQAHNSFIQLAWELGIVGFVVLARYSWSLVHRLYVHNEKKLLEGSAIICVDLLFHMPDRMTQTMCLLLAWIALCEVKIILKERAIKCPSPLPIS